MSARRVLRPRMSDSALEGGPQATLRDPRGVRATRLPGGAGCSFSAVQGSILSREGIIICLDSIAASEAPAASSVSASFSAPSRSASAAGPCVVARGGAAVAAAVDKPSRSIAWLAVASAVGNDDRAYCWPSPLRAAVLPLLLAVLLPQLLPLPFPFRLLLPLPLALPLAIDLPLPLVLLLQPLLPLLLLPLRSLSAVLYLDPLPVVALMRQRLLNLAFSVHGDGDVQTHDSPVDKAKLATVKKCTASKRAHGAPRLGPPLPQPRPGPHHPRPGAPRRQRSGDADERGRPGRPLLFQLELELELIQSDMAQTPVLWGEVFSTTPRGGVTPLPRRAQPLLLLFRSNPPH